MSETIIKMTGGVIRQQQNTILKDVNIEIQSGEFIYLIGKVGSGKSSFLKTLYAELPLEYGTAEVAGFQLKKIKKSQVPLLRRKCGIVFQDFKLLIDRNVYDNLEFVLRATGWKNKKAIRERIENVLEKVGMNDKQTKMPHQLSGGEQQRIVLARALLNAPPLILADEPTGNIDPETSYKLVELLKEICDTGKTIIIATHQYDLIEKYPGRVLCCENGVLFEKTKATACECTEENIPLPEIDQTIPVVEEATESPIISENEESAPETIEEIIEEKIEIPETIAIIEEEISETESQEAGSENSSLPEKKEKEDIMTLIGKLDYPEITAFDYELEAQPENPAKKKKSAQKPPKSQPHTKEKQAEESTEDSSESEKEEQSPKPEDSKQKPPTLDLELID